MEGSLAARNCKEILGESLHGRSDAQIASMFKNHMMLWDIHLGGG